MAGARRVARGRLSWGGAGAIILAGGGAGVAAPGDAPAHPAAEGHPGNGKAEGREHEMREPGARDAGARDAAPRETAAQRVERVKYVEETLAREREITKHRIWTLEMSHASWKHWRRVYRALRIRELAEDDGAQGEVARVDAYLKKATDHFLELLAELTAKAPEIPPPPTLVAPAAGSPLAVGTAVTFKMSPYKDASQYYCWFWEPGGHYWSNWQAKAEGFGESPECTIAADDPHWAKFHAGKGEFYGRAIIATKGDGGRPFRMWSEPVKADFSVTGGAAPALPGPLPVPLPDGGK